MLHISLPVHCTYSVALAAWGGSTAAGTLEWVTSFDIKNRQHIYLLSLWCISVSWCCAWWNSRCSFIKGFISIPYQVEVYVCLCPWAIVCVHRIDLNQLIKLRGLVSLHISIVAGEHFISSISKWGCMLYVCVCVHGTKETFVLWLHCKVLIVHLITTLIACTAPIYCDRMNNWYTHTLIVIWVVSAVCRWWRSVSIVVSN